MAKKKISKERKLEKELLFILGFFAALVLIFITAMFIFRNLNTFEYEGLTFTKKKISGIDFYHYYYYYLGEQDNLVRYNLYLRTDPRENLVPIYGDIEFEDSQTNYLAIDVSNLRECRQSVLAVSALSSFLIDNNIQIEETGDTDFWSAGHDNNEWITCQNKPNDKVVEVISGNETRIDLDGNCYRITVSECNILEAVEKFQVQTILDAKEARGGTIN